MLSYTSYVFLKLATINQRYLDDFSKRPSQLVITLTVSLQKVLH